MVAGGVGLGILYGIINFAPQYFPEVLLKVSRQANLLEYPEAKTCSECHTTIFEAWKKSRHSVAWVSEGYIKDSKDRTKEKCLPCHIPVEVRPGTKPDPRGMHRDDGIFCVPCHVKDKTMQGPYDLFSPSHPTKENSDYRSSRFCGSCHEKTFKEWRATSTERSCQSCHMPRTEGRLTQKFPLNMLHRKRKVADHSFPHGEIRAEDLKVDARFKNNSLIVELTNTSIPHLVPTADNGDPRLYLYAVLLNAAGEEVDNYKEILAPQQDTALPYQKKVSFDFPVFDETRSVALKVQYKPAWSKEKENVREITLNRE